MSRKTERAAFVVTAANRPSYFNMLSFTTPVVCDIHGTEYLVKDVSGAAPIIRYPLSEEEMTNNFERIPKWPYNKNHLVALKDPEFDRTLRTVKHNDTFQWVPTIGGELLCAYVLFSEAKNWRKECIDGILKYVNEEILYRLDHNEGIDPTESLQEIIRRASCVTEADEKKELLIISGLISLKAGNHKKYSAIKSIAALKKNMGDFDLEVKILEEKLRAL